MPFLLKLDRASGAIESLSILEAETKSYDDVVDDLFCKVKKELTDLISEDNLNGELCMDLLMIAKYLERIGDHAVNVAEWVEYCITGTHKKGSI